MKEAPKGNLILKRSNAFVEIAKRLRDFSNSDIEKQS
jgi:hypothetical protein